MIYAGTQWGILVLLARLGTPSEVGQFSFGLAITAPIMLFAGLQLRTVEATDAQRNFGFSDYAGLRIVTTICGVLVIFTISQVGYRGEVALVIAAFGLSKGIESLSDVIYGLWLQQERMDLIAKSLVLRGVGALLLSGILYFFFRTVWAAVFGIAAAWAMAFITHDVRFAARVAADVGGSIIPRFSISKIRDLFRLSVPLGIVSMLMSLNTNVPRYVIAYLGGMHQLGIFTAIGYVLVSGNLLVNSLGQSATPRLATFFSERRHGEFHWLSSRLIYIGAALGILGVLASLLVGRWALTFLYGQEYGNYVRLLGWLMAAMGFGYMASFAWYSLTAARKFLIQMPLFIIITLLTLGFCVVLVRTNGLIGAAQAVCAVAFVQLLATKWLLGRVVSMSSVPNGRGPLVFAGQQTRSAKESPGVSGITDHA